MFIIFFKKVKRFNRFIKISFEKLCYLWKKRKNKPIKKIKLKVKHWLEYTFDIKLHIMPEPLFTFWKFHVNVLFTEDYPRYILWLIGVAAVKKLGFKYWLLKWIRIFLFYFKNNSYLSEIVYIFLYPQQQNWKKPAYFNLKLFFYDFKDSYFKWWSFAETMYFFSYKNLEQINFKLNFMRYIYDFDGVYTYNKQMARYTWFVNFEFFDQKTYNFLYTIPLAYKFFFKSLFKQHFLYEGIDFYFDIYCSCNNEVCFGNFGVEGFKVRGKGGRPIIKKYFFTRYLNMSVERSLNYEILSLTMIYNGTLSNLIKNDNYFYTNLYASHFEFGFDVDDYKGDKKLLKEIRSFYNMSDIMLLHILFLKKFYEFAKKKDKNVDIYNFSKKFKFKDNSFDTALKSRSLNHFFFFKKSSQKLLEKKKTFFKKFFFEKYFFKLNEIYLFLRKNKNFNKGRYSRNRQTYRTGVYWCFYVNILVVLMLVGYFYRLSLNFSYFFLFFFIPLLFIFPRAFKYNFQNLRRILNFFFFFFFWLFYPLKVFINYFNKVISGFCFFFSKDLNFYNYYLCAYEYNDIIYENSKKALYWRRSNRFRLRYFFLVTLLFKIKIPKYI